MFQKQERVKDEAYREYIRGQCCIVYGCTSWPCDAAHLRHGLQGGMGLKPPDDLLNPICREHHREQTDWPAGEADWWMRRVIIPTTKAKFQEWKGRQ